MKTRTVSDRDNVRVHASGLAAGSKCALIQNSIFVIHFRPVRHFLGDSLRDWLRSYKLQNSIFPTSFGTAWETTLSVCMLIIY